MESHRVKSGFKLLTVLLVRSLVLPLSAHLRVESGERGKTEATAEEGRGEDNIVVHWGDLLLLMSISSKGVLLIQLELKGLNY